MGHSTIVTKLVCGAGLVVAVADAFDSMTHNERLLRNDDDR
jgi:hypothetical protein